MVLSEEDAGTHHVGVLRRAVLGGRVPCPESQRCPAPAGKNDCAPAHRLGDIPRAGFAAPREEWAIRRRGVHLGVGTGLTGSAETGARERHQVR